MFMYLLIPIKQSAMALAESSKGNPFWSTLTVMLFYVWFTILEALIEKQIFGEYFEHILDPFFALMFIAYSAYVVQACAEYNSK